MVISVILSVYISVLQTCTSLLFWAAADVVQSFSVLQKFSVSFWGTDSSLKLSDIEQRSLWSSIVFSVIWRKNKEFDQRRERESKESSFLWRDHFNTGYDQRRRRWPESWNDFEHQSEDFRNREMLQTPIKLQLPITYTILRKSRGLNDVLIFKYLWASFSFQLVLFA